MTPEQWKKVEYELKGVFGGVTLTIDGHEISLQREVAKNKIFTTVYVNGFVKGENLNPDKPTEITKRFYRPQSRYVYRMKRGEIREKEIKKLKRLKLHDYAEALSKRYTWYSPFWNAFRPMKSHFIKNNDSIELVRIGYKTEEPA